MCAPPERLQIRLQLLRMARAIELRFERACAIDDAREPIREHT